MGLPWATPELPGATCKIHSHPRPLMSLRQASSMRQVLRKFTNLCWASLKAALGCGTKVPELLCSKSYALTSGFRDPP